jgi:O-antigen/teichoic acid export membrane protein
MKDIYGKFFGLARSGTAKDTFVLFAGNFLNAGFGFIFTWLVARGLTVGDFGVFSAVNNLVYILIPLTSLGTTNGLVRFVAELESRGEHNKAQKYVNAALIFKVVMFLIISGLVLLLAGPVSRYLLATNELKASYWMLLIGLGMFIPSFVPIVLQAKKQFIHSVLVDVSYSAGRVVFLIPFLIGGLTLDESFQAFALTGLGSLVIVFFLRAFSFLKYNPSKKVYKDLLSFSGWIGVNNIISTIASRVDVQLLALLATASAVGYYSIAIRLAFFISFLSASFSAVLAPRFASFNNAEAEFAYIKKSFLALIPVSLGIIFWIIIARPFIAIFGDQYLPAVNVFRVLALSMIPFVLTVPSVTAIIYAIKKPGYIGRFSVVQLILVVILNLLLIPRVGVYAPALVFGVINIMLLIYSWSIVISHYKRSL